MIEWRRLPSPYRNYEVSDDGRVRRGVRELVGDVDRQGYRRVLLSYAGISKRFKVHRLVCEAWHGACPEGRECAHLDGNPANNAVGNLAWVTPSENTRHQIAHGSFKRPEIHGEDHPLSKLTAAQVAAMRERYAEGASIRSLSRSYGVGYSTARRIVLGQKWRSLSRNAEQATEPLRVSSAVAVTIPIASEAR